ncbi:MAG: DUF2459 domain-containing protein [Alphaproteobacteria bacterium]|jgi:uncharacterized protein (TIGR02117 family)|nr:DUF2459 domain-containing protein [Alphaproteobacteria bacterium]
MRRVGRWLALSLAFALLVGETATTGLANATVTIHVTSNGWHTNIVVARADLAAGSVPEVADLPEARYLSFGWGDAEYYPARRPTFGMALGAALQPTPAVVHLAGFAAPPGEALPSAEVISLKLSAGGFRSLVTYLHGSFARGGADRIAATGHGLYRMSGFYPATGEFHLFNTCNTWTARGLQAAGLDIDIASATSAEDVMAQLRD